MKAPKHLELKKKYFEKEELKKSAVAEPFGKALQNKMAKTKGNDTMIPLLRTHAWVLSVQKIGLTV